MKELYHKIRGLFDFNGRDWAILLLSLLLAFTVWLIHNLSLSYSTYLSVPVIARCDILGHSNQASESSRIVARCRTTGYEAILHKMFVSKREKPIVFDSNDLRHKDGEIWYISREDMSDYANEIYGEQTKIEFFVTDTLFFRFPEESWKKVPIVPISTLKMSPQYISKTGLKIEPDSVVIYGEPRHLENIDKVHTEHIELYNISSSLQGIARIESIDGIRMSQTDIHFYYDVTRFVEINEKMPVTVLNLPIDKELLCYPSYVDVKFVCTFPQMSDPKGSVSLYVDYEEYLNSSSGQCVVHTTNLPAGVLRVIIDDPIVECVSYQK